MCKIYLAVGCNQHDHDWTVVIWVLLLGQSRHRSEVVD